jgi:hypothetical protein
MRRALWVVVYVGIGCGGGGGKPSAAECAAFLDHGIRLEESGGVDKMPFFKYGTGQGRTAFLDACPKMVTKKQVECGVKAGDLPAFDKCIDRDALDDKIEAAYDA